LSLHDALPICDAVVLGDTAPAAFALEGFGAEAVPVAAQAAGQHQPLDRAPDRLGIEAHARFLDVEGSDGELLHAGDRLIEADARLGVFAQLGADAQREPVVDGESTFDAAAISPALVVLAELVAVDRIVEEEGEVAEQAPVVVLEIGGEAPV